MASGMSEIEKRFCEDVRGLERKCEVLEAEHEVARAQASVAKKRLEEAVALLRATIRGGPNAQSKLPFSSGWHDTPIEQAITVTAKQLESLHEAGIENVDDFERLRSGSIDTYPRGVRDLRGIGQATADKWEDEILDWIGTNGHPDDEVDQEDAGDDAE
jgi:hypothetical protein